ncbi:TPA: hypothetical protein RG687_003749 [Vibrio parahaemolyticus]|nr:hypothetical protein [Vibrio parahaemolyticus]
MSIRENVESIIDKNKALYKPIVVGGIISGGIYLNGFLSQFGIPFPLDIGVLTSALLVIGVISTLVVASISAYVLLVSFSHYDFLNTKFHFVINTTKQGVYASRARNYIKFYLLTYFVPVCCFIASSYLYYDDRVSLNGIVYFFCFYFFSYILYGYFVSSGFFLTRKERLLFSAKLFIHMIVSQAVSIASLIMFIAILAPRMGDLTDWEFSGVISIYLLVNFLCLLPIFSVRAAKNILESGELSITSEELVKKTHLTPVWLVVFLMVLLSYVPNVSAYIGEIPLRLLNIGGGVEFIAIDAKRQCDSWPDFIIAQSDKTNKCVSITGKLLIQLGDRAYAIFPKENTEVIVSLNLSKSSIVSDIPSKSTYWSSKSSAEPEPEPEPEPEVS